MVASMTHNGVLHNDGFRKPDSDMRASDSVTMECLQDHGHYDYLLVEETRCKNWIERPDVSDNQDKDAMCCCQLRMKTRWGWRDPGH